MELFTSLIKKNFNVIPVYQQIQFANIFQKIKKKVGITRPIPEFIEAPMPDVNDIALEDIDVSNPYPQEQYHLHLA